MRDEDSSWRAFLKVYLGCVSWRSTETADSCAALRNDNKGEGESGTRLG